MFERLKRMLERYEELSASLASPDTLSDMAKWRKEMREHSSLEPAVQAYKEYLKGEAELASLKEMMSDPEMKELAEQEYFAQKDALSEMEEQLKILLLPKDPLDGSNVIVEIRGGAGGEEASLFGAELMRMYKLLAEKEHWKVEDIDINDTELGGIKEAVFMLKGKDVYSKMKYESGVHRVQRVPETESQGRVHTSTVTVAVLPEAEDVDVEINEKDLRIDTYRAGGKGGQNVNKVESAIRITHIPTGMVVQCQDERSQLKNKDKAMAVLKSRLYDFYQSAKDKEYAENRKAQVGTGDRSERIRTYNYPQGRVTDHRIGMTLYSLPSFLNGDMEEMLEALRLTAQNEKLRKFED